MSCLDANAVQAYLGDRVSSTERARLDDHVDGCDACRALVAAAVRLQVGDDAPEDGARISRYVLGRRLGGGAMGEVYAAEDPELRRQVAIKLVHMSTRDADPRALSEAQALAQVSHPNVVSVFDVGTHDGMLFLAMELVDGGDLRSWLAEAPRDDGEIIDVLVAAGRGLAAVHEAGLVHRDLKPDNILVGRDGSVRVGDFGLATLAASRGSLAGTPAYMAPEVAAGRLADARSDQWSFCLTAIEALFGKHPRAGGPNRPVPAAVRRVLMRGLAARPDARHPSVAALVRALERARPRPSRWARLGLAALVAVATAGVLVVDATARARDLAAARAALAGAGDQVAGALALRFETFAALARVTQVLPMLREVASNVDKAEFGLGDAAADARRLELLHDNLASADWSMWTQGCRFIAVADYKGRLVYSSGAPAALGTDLGGLAAVARAYEPERRTASTMLVADDAPAFRAARLVDAPGDGVNVIVAGAAIIGGAPRVVFVEGLDARRVLADVTPPPGVTVALVPPGGRVVGALPPGVDPAAVMAEAHTVGGWLVVARALVAPGDPAPIGSVVLARALGGGLWAPLRTLRPWVIALALVMIAALLLSAWRRGGHGKTTVRMRLSEGP